MGAAPAGSTRSSGPRLTSHGRRGALTPPPGRARRGRLQLIARRFLAGRVGQADAARLGEGTSSAQSAVTGRDTARCGGARRAGRGG